MALLGDIALLVKNRLKPVLTRFLCFTDEAGPRWVATPGTQWMLSISCVIIKSHWHTSHRLVQLSCLGTMGSMEGEFARWSDLLETEALRASTAIYLAKTDTVP